MLFNLFRMVRYGCHRIVTLALELCVSATSTSHDALCPHTSRVFLGRTALRRGVSVPRIREGRVQSQRGCTSFAKRVAKQSGVPYTGMASNWPDATTLHQGLCFVVLHPNGARFHSSPPTTGA